MAKRKFTKTRKAAIAVLCALTVTATGLAAACANDETPDEPSSSTTQREDTQLLKNGNFEFFTVPDKAVHLIKGVDSWSRSGDSSGTMSGIIDTSEESWKAMTADDLKSKLDANNDLSTSDPDYDEKHVDYNGMDSEDIVYKEPYAATLDTISDDDSVISKRFNSYAEFLGISESDGTYFIDRDGDGTVDDGERVYAGADESDKDFYFDEARTQAVRYEKIANPETHLGKYTESEGKFYLGTQQIYKDDDGKYYSDEDKTQPTGNVLMIHNFPTNRLYNGIEQHYTSQSITLEANTAAEISVWVKTSDLKFDKGAAQIDDQDRGAYIQVSQTIGSSSVDPVIIKAINTQKIIRDNPELDTNNGWLQYTIYINACDFSDTTITIALGLGDSSTQQKVTGYAFFDDVEVKKFIDLNDEGCSYSDNSAKIAASAKINITTEEDDRILFADKQIRKTTDDRLSKNFHYFIDLASSSSEGKQAVALKDNVSVILTEEKSGIKTYSSSLTNNAKLGGGVVSGTAAATALPAGWKDGKETKNDLIGVYGANKVFASTDFNGGEDWLNDYSDLLNKGLSGDNGLSALSSFGGSNSADMLVMLSAYGAAYTSTVNNAAFTVEKDGYKILSLWVKTSDMSGQTAATVKITDKNDDKVSASIALDTTGVTTDIGDNENIYKDWVQCFFFVHNEGDEDRTFELSFSIGNTTIVDTSYSNYAKGWVALANLQVFKLTEDSFNLASEGDRAKILTLGEKKDSDSETSKFDDVKGTSDIKKAMSLPSSYNGVNGGSIYVSDGDYSAQFDKQNGNVANSGLISKEYINNYSNGNDILSKFDSTIDTSISAVENWQKVFGNDCYQPLIIIDSLRDYYENATATETTYSEYYIKNDDGDFVKATEWKEDETYYALKHVKNYGYIGSTLTVNEDEYATVSVKVMVSGEATAYVYLVDTDTREVMSYSTPSYTFFYDDEGNVLKEAYNSDWTEKQHKDAIVYSLRDDGLYDGEDGGVYANLYNLTKNYKFAKFEHDEFYDESGNRVSFDDLKEGVTYYSDSAKQHKASCYLVVNEQIVYEYDGATDTYYYRVGGTRGAQVKPFDVKYARYVAGESAPQLSAKITNTNGKWATVNFVIHAGNAAKNYRLELWSGQRGEKGENDTNYGAIAFDYSAYSVTSDNYANILGEYEQKIVSAYKNILKAENALDKLTENTANIAQLESIIKELGVTPEKISQALQAEGCSEYAANYYTFTLYDSAQFVPFDKLTANEGEIGYDYSISDYPESLSYFSFTKSDDNSYNMFADYSMIDKTIEISTSDADTDTDDEETENNDNGNGWLLITSIILTVVIIFALLAILVRDIVKKRRKKKARKNQEKNNYKKRDRYIRKLGLVKAADVEEEPAESAEPEKSDEPAKVEEPAETPAEEKTEEKVDETPAETPAESDESAKVEQPAETPAEQTSAEQPAPEAEQSEEPAPAEQPADDDKKQ